MNIKTKKILTFGAVALLVGMPMIAAAGGFIPNRNIGPTGLAETTIVDIIFTVLQWLLLILTFVAVIGFVISGIMYITAGGSDRADDARKWLTYSIIGIVIALLGYIIVTFVATTLLGTVQQ